jgi:hypothetical protein
MYKKDFEHMYGLYLLVSLNEKMKMHMWTYAL